MKKIIFLLFLSFFTLSPASAQSNDTVTSLNAFAFDMYSKVSEPNTNAVFSPYSLSSLLGILVSGSAGKTHDQLVKVLHLDPSKNLNNLNAELDKINTALTAKASCAKPADCSGDATVIANAIWADQNFTYKNTFLNSLQPYHGINFFRVDFAHEPNQAKDKINAWVDSNTKGYIKNLFDEIPNTTKLVLTNAIYFKGSWQLPFQTDNTQPHTFTADNGNRSQALMMHQQDNFLYAEDDMLQMLQLPYAHSSLAMAILLPKPKHNLQELLHKMNDKSFEQLSRSCYPVDVNVSLPKFKLDSRFDSLSQSLQSLGLTQAFTNQANFSNITNDKLLISQVIQKAVIQVDEKGTVAAAATGLVMKATMALPPSKPINFMADHPFLFVIFDKQSGLIVFMGQVSNP